MSGKAIPRKARLRKWTFRAVASLALLLPVCVGSAQDAGTATFQSLRAQTGIAGNAAPLPLEKYACADSARCDSPQDVAFEQARKSDLKSGDPDVVRAAQAYRDGVTIEFGDPGAGMESATIHGILGKQNTVNTLRAIETVIFRPGLSPIQLEVAVGHEGSHIADAQAFVNAITPTGRIDESKNISEYESELRAYGVTQSILAAHRVSAQLGQCEKGTLCRLGAGIDPTRVIRTINALLANPANRCGDPPFYGLTREDPGPALFPQLTAPYLTPAERAAAIGGADETQLFPQF